MTDTNVIDVPEFTEEDAAKVQPLLLNITTLRWRTVYVKHYKLTTDEIQGDGLLALCVILNELRYAKYKVNNLVEIDNMTQGDVLRAIKTALAEEE